MGSLYPDKHDTAYYVNLAHADKDNCIPWEKAKELLDAKSPTAAWVAHNLRFELVVMMNSLGYELGSSICTLQMAVSAYGPD